MSPSAGSGGMALGPQAGELGSRERLEPTQFHRGFGGPRRDTVDPPVTTNLIGSSDPLRSPWAVG